MSAASTRDHGDAGGESCQSPQAKSNFALSSDGVKSDSLCVQNRTKFVLQIDCFAFFESRHCLHTQLSTSSAIASADSRNTDRIDAALTGRQDFCFQ